MQILIDIPDNMFKIIKENGEGTIGVLTKELFGILMRGIILPKGHGALKDTDKIISDGISKGFCDWYDEIKYANTIIEADRESEG